MIKLLPFICFAFRLNDVESSEIHNDSLVQISSENPLESYSVLPDFPLHKCHCGVNNIWQNGRCQPMHTVVEFVLQYFPFLTKEVDTNEFKDVVVSAPKCESSMASVAIQNVAFTKNKTLFHWESGDNFRSLYCVEHIKNGKGNIVLEAHVCIPNLKIPVCCPSGFLLNPQTLECYEQRKTFLFSPPVNVDSKLMNTTNITSYLHPFPNCSHDIVTNRILGTTDGLKAILLYQSSNIIFFEGEGSYMETIPQTIKHPQDYCVAVQNQQEPTIYSVLYWDELSFFYCDTNVSSQYNESTEKCEDVMTWILLPLLGLSAVFLLLILCLHGVMAELRKSLGSKLTMCHVASLFLGFCFLLCTPAFEGRSCKIFGPLVQVSFLATFFWLNVMCFDIWRKLRCNSPAGETIQSSHLQFVRYSLYAWGSPLFIGLVTVIMDNVPGLEEHQGVLVPGFGRKGHCWFANPDATFAYYFGIIGVLMVVNTFFFGWVFVILVRANCTYGKILKNSQRKSSRTWIYFKIFGVMGVTWIFELHSWQTETCKYWIVTDIINALRGPILFLIFFGNKNSIKKIRQRFSTMNQSFHDQWSRSVNSLRRLNLKTPIVSTETGLNSRRTSETHAAELSNRTHIQDVELG